MKPRNKFKRRLNGKTDYKARFALLKSGKFRLVVRKTTNNIITQIVNYLPEGDEVLVKADLLELKKEFGWKLNNNLPGAYLIGYLLGVKAKKHKISEAILDIGLHSSTKGGKIFAAVKGAVDAGLNVPVGEKVLPTEDRIKGAHIKEYAKDAKDPHFKKYKIEPEKIQEHFEEVLKKVKGA